jgi:hypothetical protein
MPVGDYIRCPACGNKDHLEAHFVDRKLVNFTCPCGQTFTGRESAGSSRPERRPMDKKREQELLEDAVAGERVTRLLSCELTNEEQRQCGIEQGLAFDEVTRLENEAKRIAKEWQAMIEAAKQRHAMLKNVVLQKSEYRDTDCHEWRDFKLGKVFVMRDDLGLIVEQRNMTPEERQELIPGMEVSPGVKLESVHDVEPTSKKKARATAGAASAAS